ncbi:MAG TPA: ABC transporter permease [Blastocatellia bacterium]|nr:ABC transporter permease [Blastocatellia bacterium]
MGILWQDIKYGVRMLLRQPVFTVVAVLTLAMGIGANSAIFSVINAVLLRPLALHEPERIIKIWESKPEGFTGTASVPNLVDWREQNDVFTNIAAYQFANFSLQGQDYPERVRGLTATPDLFDVLGVAPQIGRTFTSEEDQAGSHRVVVLSHRLWQRNFGGDREIVGREVMLNGESYTVVGVMPASFIFPGQTTELWVPLVFTETQRASRGTHAFFAIGRLKPGVTFEQAQEQMIAIASRIEQQYPNEQALRSVLLIPLQEETVRFIRPALFVLLGAVGLVLLIACTNVANLQLARASARRREIAIRTALGAGRGRLARQFLTESVMLSLAGGAVGLLLALWGGSALVSMASGFLPRASEIGLDGRVLVFTFIMSLLTGVVFGLAPAFYCSKTDVQKALKEGGSAGEGPQRNWIRSILVVGEVAAALVLLIGAGLLIKSFARLQQVDSGLRPENVLTLSIALPQAKYPTQQTTVGFYNQLLERVSGLPGVESAGIINFLPMQQWGFNGDITIEGQGPYPPGQSPLAEYRAASPDYFRALGISLIAGRLFDERDQENSQKVIIINQELVRRYMLGEDPIGRRIRAFGSDWRTIVGVVRDVKQSGLMRNVMPEIFLPYTQVPSASTMRGMSLAARTATDPLQLADAIRAEVLAIDPAQPVYNVQPMEAVIANSISDRRLNMVLLSIFAGLALLLAIVGVFGVMSYTVTQSTREIGIRMALGAKTTDVLRLVVGQGLMLTGVGVVIGAGAAVALTRLMASLLFGVGATDFMTYAAAIVALVIVAAIACYLPARRATKVDPMIALRYE